VNADWPDSLDITAGYHGGDDFSEAAHDTIVDEKSRLQRMVFDYVARCSTGATCEEVELALGLSHQTASARITELRSVDQLVNVDGERRRTLAGRWARVHRIAVRASA
jgi:hypothetical protein